MTTKDPVPEADRLEQELAPTAAPTGEEHHRHRTHADADDADAFEQELPLADAAADPGIHAERSEPLDDDRDETGRG